MTTGSLQGIIKGSLIDPLINRHDPMNHWLNSWKSKGPTPPQCQHSPRNKALLWDYEAHHHPLGLIKALFPGVNVAWGRAPLDSHDKRLPILQISHWNICAATKEGFHKLFQEKNEYTKHIYKSIYIAYYITSINAKYVCIQYIK